MPVMEIFSSTITRLGTKDVDFVYYGGYYPELGRLLRQARAAGLKV
jgi:branched-chain amino acid transport system substrate-binding protein